MSRRWGCLSVLVLATVLGLVFLLVVAYISGELTEDHKAQSAAPPSSTPTSQDGLKATSSTGNSWNTSPARSSPPLTGYPQGGIPSSIPLTGYAHTSELDTSYGPHIVPVSSSEGHSHHSDTSSDSYEKLPYVSSTKDLSPTSYKRLTGYSHDGTKAATEIATAESYDRSYGPTPWAPIVSGTTAPEPAPSLPSPSSAGGLPKAGSDLESTVPLLPVFQQYESLMTDTGEILLDNDPFSGALTQSAPDRPADEFADLIAQSEPAIAEAATAAVLDSLQTDHDDSSVSLMVLSDEFTDTLYSIVYDETPVHVRSFFTKFQALSWPMIGLSPNHHFNSTSVAECMRSCSLDVNCRAFSYSPSPPSCIRFAYRSCWIDPASPIVNSIPVEFPVYEKRNGTGPVSTYETFPNFVLPPSTQISVMKNQTRRIPVEIMANIQHSKDIVNYAGAVCSRFCLGWDLPGGIQCRMFQASVQISSNGSDLLHEEIICHLRSDTILARERPVPLVHSDPGLVTPNTTSIHLVGVVIRSDQDDRDRLCQSPVH